MRNWVLLIGLAAVLAALLIAGAEAQIADQAARANVALAGGIYTIPLAAFVRI